MYLCTVGKEEKEMESLAKADALALGNGLVSINGSDVDEAADGEGRLYQKSLKSVRVRLHSPKYVHVQVCTMRCSVFVVTCVCATFEGFTLMEEETESLTKAGVLRSKLMTISSSHVDDAGHNEVRINL